MHSPTLGPSAPAINATIWRDKENRKNGVTRNVSQKQDLFSLPTGSVLQIQATVPDDAPRYSVRLIGSLPGASLVITTPTIDRRLQIIREGQRFAVRVLKGERVFGFVARVLFASMKPYPHLHLEYPHQWKSATVRNAGRIQTNLPALVTLRDIFLADGLGGKGYLLFGGPLVEVEAAVDYGTARARGAVVGSRVIAQLHGEMDENLVADGRFAARVKAV